ncbi:hypothetical protein NY78_2314 [Desulfovibrio sp. TomC]|nr:hypothetical protein NY78_2314 [Desulfovibrio sp. TomC]
MSLQRQPGLSRPAPMGEIAPPAPFGAGDCGEAVSTPLGRDCKAPRLRTLHAPLPRPRRRECGVWQNEPGAGSGRTDAVSRRVPNKALQFFCE